MANGAPALLRTRQQTYVADSCEPLKNAAALGDLTLKGWSHGPYPGQTLPETVLPGLSSAGVWDARRPQSWGLGWHRNEGIELTYVSRGRVPFACAGRAWTLHPGAFTVTRPWQPHRVGDPHVPPSRLAWLIIDVGVRRPDQTWTWPPWVVFAPDDLRALEKLLRTRHEPVWNGSPQLSRAFERLIDLLDTPAPARQTRLAVMINELLVVALETLTDQLPEQTVVLRESRQTVQRFLHGLPGRIDHPWTLATMAAACGLGRSQFATHCQALTNMTPINYLTASRIGVAQRMLLEHPALSITDISSRCGFSSSQYFAGIFRRDTGHTPSEFRRLALGPND